MGQVSSAVENAINGIAAGTPDAAGCYTDEEGYLRCKVCGDRRETTIKFRSATGMKERKVRCVCRCERERSEREKEEREKEEAKAKARSLKKASLMDERFYTATFNNAKETQYNKKNLGTCRRYAEIFPEMVMKKQGLLFWGDVGTGKSYASACIANYLLGRGVPVVMTSFVKAIEAIRSREQEERLFGIVATVKLLILDDFGAERTTDYALEKVYDIVDSRYRSGLPLIVTTNLSMDEMLQERDTRYSRIYDRIFEMCYPVQWTGPSWRRRMAKGRFDEMGRILGG